MALRKHLHTQPGILLAYVEVPTSDVNLKHYSRLTLIIHVFLLVLLVYV